MHADLDEQRDEHEYAKDEDEHIEDLLDDALADSFPASDPVSSLKVDPTPEPRNR